MVLAGAWMAEAKMVESEVAEASSAEAEVVLEREVELLAAEA